MALGVVEDAACEQGAVHLAHGDMLVLHTDGITDAQDRQGAVFGEERLHEVARANLFCSAQDVQEAVIAEVHEFVGDAPRFDDIALMVVVRDSAPE
jgi:sigma-B regulation protein RsbU (phosphoserine phosphatase)